MVKHLATALGPGGSSYRTQRKRGLWKGMPDRNWGLGSRWGPATPRDPAGRKPAPLSFLTLICHWHLPLAEPSWNPEARKPVSISPLG